MCPRLLSETTELLAINQNFRADPQDFCPLCTHRGGNMTLPVHGLGRDDDSYNQLTSDSCRLF